MIGPLIGMVHLDALPGSPGFAGGMDSIIDHAVSDASTLHRAGFDAILVENFGDVPFFADTVPPVTVAAMSRVAGAVADTVSLPFGVNVLRNDAFAALSVAAVCGASFIRVNVLGGTMYSDQGVLHGRGAEVARLKSSLAPGVLIFADVFVKHAVPPPGLALAQAAEDLCARGGADALIVSGVGTGRPTDLEAVDQVRRVCSRLPTFVGSGATPRTVAAVLQHAHGVIVGTAIETDGRVDPEKAAEFVAAAGKT
jgi:membrane complex biogenesis BtpA family protein